MKIIIIIIIIFYIFNFFDNVSKKNIINILKKKHENLKLNYGSLNEEYNEQIMALKFIKPHHYVLELGGNIGRNSCLISSLLKNSNQLLVIESEPNNVIKLIENKNLNNFNFNIEDCAISNINLYQKNDELDSITLPKNKIDNFDKWKKIKTLSWHYIKNKYNIKFDVLVVDCEGCLYYILKNEPDFLNDFKIIIIENDFTNILHKKYVNYQLKKHLFTNIYKKSWFFNGAINYNFYEVWIKKTYNVFY